MTPRMDLFPICGWCPPNSPEATERVVYQHGYNGCWCEGGAAPVTHVAWVCAAHLDRELEELHYLGFWRVEGDGR